MRKLVELMADNAVFSICDLVCGGECTAVDGFTTSKREICESKISAFLEKYLEADNMKDGLLGASECKCRKGHALVEDS